MIDFSTLPPLIFVSGKGGVGKTTFSLKLSSELALKGKKVLYVSLTDVGFVSEVLGVHIGQVPVTSGRGFDVANWTGLGCLKEYVAFKSKSKWVAEAFFKNRFLSYLLSQAPGLSEISILGKITSGIRSHGPDLNYDHIVVDAFSSGHFISMIKTPKALSETASFGPMHKESLEINKILIDQNISKYFLISLFEDYSIQEASETIAEIKKITFQTPTVIGNKKLECPNPEETKRLSEFLKRQQLLDDRLKIELGMRLFIPLFFKNAKNILTDKEVAWLIQTN